MGGPVHEEVEQGAGQEAEVGDRAEDVLRVLGQEVEDGDPDERVRRQAGGEGEFGGGRRLAMHEAHTMPTWLDASRVWLERSDLARVRDDVGKSIVGECMK